MYKPQSRDYAESVDSEQSWKETGARVTRVDKAAHMQQLITRTVSVYKIRLYLLRRKVLLFFPVLKMVHVSDACCIS